MTDYTTLTDVKLQVEIPAGTTTKDAAISYLITKASRAIDAYCGYPDDWFVALTVATAKTFPGSGYDWMYIPECISISKVEVKDSPTDTDYVEWTTADWLAFTGDPETPMFDILPYRGIMTDSVDGSYSTFTGGSLGSKALPTVRITAKWGIAATVPGAIAEATAIQTARWLKRAQMMWGDAIAQANLGQVQFVKSVDPAIEALLDKSGYVSLERRR